MHNNSAEILSVSQLNQAVKLSLETQFHNIWISGEISNFIVPSSGHWYFSLKDDNSQVRAVMFRFKNSLTKFEPQNGMQVLVKINVSLYEPRGDYQIIVEEMRLDGEGLLHQKFEMLKAKLGAKGFFDPEFKQALPKFCQTVGVVTSPTGAVIQDILRVLKRRDPNIRVVVYPCLVQGAEASAQIAEMIELANQRNEVEVLIVGRGGGSLEDLWAFNEEIVAQAIFNSELPVISAVGHEVDFTIADFVADVRASTPSVAAEMIGQDQRQLWQQCVNYEQSLEMALDYLLTAKEFQATKLNQRLKAQHPTHKLNLQTQYLKQLHQHLNRNLAWYLERQTKHLSQLQQSLNYLNLPQKINAEQQNLTTQINFLTNHLHNHLQQAGLNFKAQCASLNNLSPLKVLARGYSITQTANGKEVKKISQVKAGDLLKTKLQQGTVISRVKEVLSSSKAR